MGPESKSIANLIRVSKGNLQLFPEYPDSKQIRFYNHAIKQKGNAKCKLKYLIIDETQNQRSKFCIPLCKALERKSHLGEENGGGENCLQTKNGLNQGGSGLPFKCSGIDQVRPSLGSQLQKPFVETTNQVQILSQRWRLQLLEPELQWLEWEQQEQRQLLVQDAARLLLAQSRGSSIQASSPKVGVDSQDQEELTMEASTIRSPPINPSPLYSQGVAQSKAGLVNEGTEYYLTEEEPMEDIQADQPEDFQQEYSTDGIV